MATLYPGPKTLLLGEPGTGKTYAIATLVKAGITPFCIFTEATMPVLNRALEEMGLPLDSYHYRFIPESTADVSDILNNFRRINTLSYKTLADTPDGNKSKYKQMLKLGEALNDFVCDRTGESFGNVGHWGPKRCLVLDNLSGTNGMFKEGVVGGKPVLAQGEWQIAMQAQRSMLVTLTNMYMSLVVIGHLEPEQDEVLGFARMFPGVLGRKTAPTLPGKFDEVIASRREGLNFKWTNIAERTATKSRLLALNNDLKPDFVQIFEAWKKYGGTLSETVE